MDLKIKIYSDNWCFLSKNQEKFPQLNLQNDT